MPTRSSTNLKEHLNTNRRPPEYSWPGTSFTPSRRFDSCLAHALDAKQHSALGLTTRAGHDRKPLLDGLHPMSACAESLKLDSIHAYDMACRLSRRRLRSSLRTGGHRLLEAVKPLGVNLSVLTKSMQSRWVDVFETPGKGGGAYSSGSYTVNVCADELQRHRRQHVHPGRTQMGPPCTRTCSAAPSRCEASYSIFVAEVASTLNEGLLMHLLLKETTDTRKRLFVDRYG